MTEKEILEIEKILDNAEMLLGWCCVCGKPIVDGAWNSVMVYKPDDVNDKGFHIDHIKKHSGCCRN